MKFPAETRTMQAETPLEALSSTCVAFAVWVFVTTFVVQNFRVPSGSMEKTLLVGDHVAVDRTSFAPPTRWAPFVHYREPRRGDVIVFFKPNPETPDLILVKRVIGVAGDRIHLVHGIVYLNGVPQNEPYAAEPDDPGSEGYDAARDDFPALGPPPSSLTTAVWTDELPTHLVDGELVVPDGKFFAMGDNRTHSADGRFWGFVPRENILGRPLFNYWSYQESEAEADVEHLSWGVTMKSIFSTTLHFFGGTRWRRTGKVIR